jgi:regulator of sirC expression with transglutaminase-like and TPR domain
MTSSGAVASTVSPAYLSFRGSVLGASERSAVRTQAPFAESPEFQRLLRRDAGSDLVRIALEIARDAEPNLDMDHYLGKIEALSGRARDRCPPGAKPRSLLGQINWVLFVEEGFQGNSEDYYDPRNGYLNHVIDRKTGNPITLSVLYASIAAGVGLEMAGVNLPAHFMLRAGSGDSTIFVDPFHAGALLDRRGCERRIGQLVGQEVALSDIQLAPCGHDLIVARMLRNLKSIYLEQHNYSASLPVLQRLAALNPGDPHEQRDLGMLCLQLDRPTEAISPLQSYLDARPRAPDADAVRPLLRAARRNVALRN